MPSVNSYDLFAKYYDALHYNEFSFHAAYYLDDILASLNFDGTDVLDLACGTGTTALWFAEQGYNVTAIDFSTAMLYCARKKVLKGDLKINFRKLDMRKLGYHNKFNMVICLFDSLNHIVKQNELEQVFKNVSHALKPNGYFLFDMITPYELLTQWNNTVRHESNGNISLLLHSEYYKKSRLSKIKARFIRKSGKRIQQHIRHFQNKAYTQNEIKQTIKKSGLCLLNQYHCFTFDPPNRKTNRIFYVTQKLGTTL